MRLGRSSGPHHATSAIQLLDAIFNHARAYDDAEGKPLLAVNPVIGAHANASLSPIQRITDRLLAIAEIEERVAQFRIAGQAQ